MNVKKLIGAIIGVTAFAALIAGATFAWLFSNATVNNSIFTGTSKNFIITYTGSTGASATVSGFKQIVSGSATTAAITSSTSAGDANDGWAAVTASKTVNDAPAGSFKIKLAIETNTFTTNAITWAICKGNCPTGIALATVTEGNATCGSGVTNCGTIEAGSQTEVPLYDDTTTFNTDSAASATYNVYFWLDSGTLNNDDLDIDDHGHPASFAGYIHAEATQAD